MRRNRPACFDKERVEKMIELPEGIVLAGQCRAALSGKTVKEVLPPSAPHKFCWFRGDPADYHAALAERTMEGAESFGIYVELSFSGGVRLCVNDGVNLRLLAPGKPAPARYQLLIRFTDASALVFTVAMYGGIICHRGDYDNEYYRKSRQSLSPLDPAYGRACFERIFEGEKPGLSAKALLASGQRIPGLGNGVLQDILWTAGVHPKRGIGTLGEPEHAALFVAVRTVLAEMAAQGGRETERDLFGNPGGYRGTLSKNTLGSGCPRCGGPIVKEIHLGGAVYFCPACQPLK